MTDDFFDNPFFPKEPMSKKNLGKNPGDSFGESSDSMETGFSDDEIYISRSNHKQKPNQQSKRMRDFDIRMDRNNTSFGTDINAGTGFDDDEVFISRSNGNSRQNSRSKTNRNTMSAGSYPSKGTASSETGFSDDESYITRPKRNSFNSKVTPTTPTNSSQSRVEQLPAGENQSVGRKAPPQHSAPKKKKRKKHRKWPYLFLILVILLVGAFFYIWNSSFFQNDTDTGSAGLDPEISSNEKGIVNILFVGIDNDQGRRENMLTDTIMVISVNSEVGQASVLQIPRDTYIGTSYTATGKINALYSSASAYSGIEGLCNFVYDNMGIPLDHYATITMEGLREVIDAIGGVTMDVPYEVNLDGVVLEPGVQTLDGNEAEKLIRQRHGDGYANGDLDRLKVQRLFMASLVEQFLGTSKSTLLSILPGLSDEITTDMSTKTIVDILTKVSGMSADSIGFYMVPGQSTYVNTTSYGRQSVYSIHKQLLAEMINEYFLAGHDPITVDTIKLPELDNDTDAFDDVGGSVNQILGNESDSESASSSESSSTSGSSSQKASTSTGKKAG